MWSLWIVGPTVIIDLVLEILVFMFYCSTASRETTQPSVRWQGVADCCGARHHLHDVISPIWLHAGLSNIPRSNIATPTNNVHLASPPIGESRAGTISDTVRYNQEMDNTRNSPPVFRPPPPQGTPPIVVEVKNLEVLCVEISSLLTPMREGYVEGGGGGGIPF